MALGYLFIFFVFLFLLTMISMLLLVVVKQAKMESMIILFTALLGIGLSYLGVTALPTNFIGLRVIGCFFGVLAGGGLVLHYRKKTLAAKIMIALSLVLGLANLVFG